MGACPGFRNVVFDGNASLESGWPSNTWSSLSSHGVDDWSEYTDPIKQSLILTIVVGFTLVNPAVSTSQLNAHQIHLVMDPRNVQDAVNLLQTAPPRYLGLFNEPDFPFEGGTPLTDPVTAAKALQPIFAAAVPQTTFLSPALAQANSDWLATFRNNCNGCFDKIPIISQHIYSTDTDYVMGQITTLHATWPDKKIWITELGPAVTGCTMDNNGIIDWMNRLMPQIRALPYVEKVFWNCGEHGAGIDGKPDGPCNPSLTNEDGSPTDILTAYSRICSGPGLPAASIVATS